MNAERPHRHSPREAHESRYQKRLREQQRRREADQQRMRDRLEQLVSDEAVDEHLSEEHAMHRVLGGTIALALFVMLLIWLLSSLSWYPEIAAQLHLSARPTVWTYLVAGAAFLPLAIRDYNPVLAYGMTSAFAVLYLAMSWPPSLVILAPMLALFTIAERYGNRHAIPLGVTLGAMLLVVSAFAVSLPYTITQLVAILALLALSAALGHATRQRRELFEEVRSKRREEQLRRIEEERLRIARDVHDIMAHSLTLMTLQADAGLVTAEDTEKSRAAFEIIGTTGRDTLRDLRSMLSVLTGGTDDSPREPVADLGRLGELVASVREAGLDVTLETNGDLDAVPSAVAVSAYRIIQEALTNVVRHAHALHATVRVDVTPDKLELRVADNGVGGSIQPLSGEGAGRGIAGMRERVEVLGGTIEAGPATTGGFEVAAVLPLTRSQR